MMHNDGMDLEPVPAEPRPGVYRHYKGQRYKVLYIARHSESLEFLVVYKALYDNGDIWARPLKIFLESVNLDGREITRFEYMQDKEGVA